MRWPFFKIFAGEKLISKIGKKIQGVIIHLHNLVAMSVIIYITNLFRHFRQIGFGKIANQDILKLSACLFIYRKRNLGLCKRGRTCDFAQGRRSAEWKWKGERGWRDISVEGSISRIPTLLLRPNRSTRWENGGRLGDSDARAVPHQRPTFSSLRILDPLFWQLSIVVW